MNRINVIKLSRASKMLALRLSDISLNRINVIKLSGIMNVE
jgi:hypothetical protein